MIGRGARWWMAAGALLSAAAGCERRAVDTGAPLVTASCAAAPVVPPRGICRAGEITWCWENPLPAGEDVLALGGTSTDDLWVMTPAMVAHVAGGVWTSTMEGPFMTGAFFTAGPGDVWLATARAGTPTQDLVDGGLLPSSVPPAVWRWDGSAWTLAYVFDGIGDTVAALWGSGPADVWVGGHGLYGGGIAHFDGAVWTRVDIDPSGPVDVAAIWGSAAADVWVTARPAGTSVARVYHFDGQSWTQAPYQPDDPSFAPISGSGPSDVWIAGQSTLGHFDGSTWTSQTLASQEHLPPFVTPVALGPRDVWALPALSELPDGAACLLSHFDGAAWTETTIASDPAAGFCFEQAVGWPRGGLVAGGRQGNLQALTCDGGFQPLTRRTAGAALYAVSAIAPDDVWAVGRGGVALHGTGAGAWTAVPTPTTATLNALWAAGPNDVWAVGASGTAIRWDGARWTAWPTGTGGTLVAVSGSGVGDVWAVSGQQPAAVLRFDGQAWSVMHEATDDAYTGVAAVAPDDVWIAVTHRPGGGFLHWTGAAFEAVAAPGPDDAAPYAIKAFARDDIWADSPMRWVFHYDGAAWRVVAAGDVRRGGQMLGYGPFLTRISGNPGQTPYFLLQSESGAMGNVARLDTGGALRALPKLYTRTEHYGLDVRGRDIWLVGSGSAIEHGTLP
jgi:hypothetical protein